MSEYASERELSEEANGLISKAKESLKNNERLARVAMKEALHLLKIAHTAVKEEDMETANISATMANTYATMAVFFKLSSDSNWTMGLKMIEVENEAFEQQKPTAVKS